jgi:HEPN domain-containing protein
MVRPVDRSDFQSLANLRHVEAQHLLAAGHYSGAYYLAGYTVECALKACICRRIQPDVWPDRDFSKDIHTHNLANLLRFAGLQGEVAATSQREVNWNVVKDWTERSRYEIKPSQEAIDLLAAVSDSNEGVLAWLTQRW